MVLDMVKKVKSIWTKLWFNYKLVNGYYVRCIDFGAVAVGVFISISTPFSIWLMIT